MQAMATVGIATNVKTRQLCKSRRKTVEIMQRKELERMFKCGRDGAEAGWMIYEQLAWCSHLHHGFCHQP
jgi:hypothetical protein